MLRLRADSFLLMARDLATFENLELSGISVRWNGPSMIEGLLSMEAHMRELELSASASAAARFRMLLEESHAQHELERQAPRKWWQLGSNAPSVSPMDLAKHAFMLNRVVRDELAGLYCLAIPVAKADFYTQSEPLFGREVESKLAAASEDISEAGKCISTARYTASVFHLMRVLEIGVTKFAGILSITPIDSRGKGKNWHNFLDEANKAIRAMTAPADQDKARKYAAISSHLYNVKLAWRNEVMHPKQTYTEEEAAEVFSASKAFVRELVSVL